MLQVPSRSLLLGARRRGVTRPVSAARSHHAGPPGEHRGRGLTARPLLPPPRAGPRERAQPEPQPGALQPGARHPLRAAKARALRARHAGQGAGAEAAELGRCDGVHHVQARWARGAGAAGRSAGDPRWAPLWAASHPAAGASCPRGRGRTTAPPEHGAPVPAAQQDLSAACVSRSLGVQAASQLRQNQHGVKCTT